MPSSNYDQRIPLFESLVASGLDTMIHPTGFTGIRIVAGVPKDNIDPFYHSLMPGRAKGSGEFGIYLADSVETASYEVFGDTGVYKENTWKLSYEYQGHILNISKCPDLQIKNSFTAYSGADKHEFSQDFRHYLEQKGLVAGTGCDSIGWQSVAGKQLGHDGYASIWTSGYNKSLNYLGMERLDAPSSSDPNQWTYP